MNSNTSTRVNDRLGRPIQIGDEVLIGRTETSGFVIRKTSDRRTMVDVRIEGTGRVHSFYGTSLVL